MTCVHKWKIGKKVIATFVSGALLTGIACNPDKALFVQDWVRDLAVGGTAMAAALAAIGQAPPTDVGEAAQGERGAPGAPGAPGEQGPAGPQGSQGEQGADGTQGDQGPQGQQPATGAQGEQGPQGATGAQGVQGAAGDPGEQGPQGQIGQQGPQGEQGQQGELGPQGEQGQQGGQGEQGLPGPEFFSVFVDEFFTFDAAQSEYVATSDSNPAFYDGGKPPVSANGWKFALPNRYAGVNPVTMRLFIYYDADTPRRTECEIFELVGVRFRDGDPVGQYGTTAWVALEVESQNPSQFLVVDLPLNSPAGLNWNNDLEAGQLLGFGMRWDDGECYFLGEEYRILGVEFFETLPGGEALGGAQVLPANPGCVCGDPPK